MNNGRNQSPQQPQQPSARLELVPVETSKEACALVPSTIDGAFRLAQWLSSAQLLPPALRGKEADIFTMVLAGMELGLPPMAALRGMYIVNGKPALEAKTKAALCLQKGAAVYFKQTEYTDKAVTWETLRRGEPEARARRYTLKEAQDAGLAPSPNNRGKDGPWQQYPTRMISWKALGQLCDDTYPDIVLGVATAEDFDDEQIAFKPIATVAAGVELGTAGPAPAARVSGPTVTISAKGLERVAAAAGAPMEIRTDEPATSTPKAITEEEVSELITAMQQCKTKPELRKLAADRIAGIADGPVRDRLANAYYDQRILIEAAERDEKAGQ